MKVSILAVALCCGCLAVIHSQEAIDAALQAQLRRLFPAALAFARSSTSLRHFDVFAGGQDSGSRTLIGYAFWTTELEPLERGYHGPIKILVGMDTKGVLSGIVVAAHHEPYGYFSVEPPEFAMQFKGKNIRDPFRVGQDIDAVSRASLTIASATRAVRNSARRVARELLPPQP
jgi:transcriptional regulator of nitric oxide reductase